MNDNYLTTIKKSSDLSDELIKAMDLIAKARINELAFDKTINAEIVRLSDAELGEYSVKYQNGVFNAYVLDEKQTYNKGDSVYVKIPNGNFSNKKIIEGRSNISSLSEADYDYLSNQIVEMNVWYESEKDEMYSIAASKEEQEIVIYDNLDSKSSEDFINLFKTYPRIKISADFKTLFPNKNIPYGDFGLKVEFYYKTTDGSNSISYDIETRRLSNIQNFVGNLNEYLIFSPQYALYDFKDMNAILTGIKKISLYTRNYSDKVDYSVEGVNNIFVQNIKLSFMDRLDQSDDLYYIGIRSNDGTILQYDDDVINLEGLFFYQGKELTQDKAKCQCYWFRQNLEVTESHANYNKYAGPGWELITNDVLKRLENGEITVAQARAYLDKENAKTYALYGSRLQRLKELKDNYDQSMAAIDKNDIAAIMELNESYQRYKSELYVEFQEAVEHNILRVRSADVYQTAEFKFVVVYGSDKRYSKTIAISKKSIQRFNLIKTYEDSNTLLKLTDARVYENETETVADWYVLLSNGDYLPCEKKTSIMNITKYLIYPEATFYANVYASENQKIPMKFYLKNYLATDDIKVYFSGTDTFIYDNNGERKVEPGEVDELKITISTNNTRIITNNNIKWYLQSYDGKNRITLYDTAQGNLNYAETIIPDRENSMIKSISVTSDGLNLFIKTRELFESSRISNLLILKIDFEGDAKDYEFTKVINFIKQSSHTVKNVKYDMILKYYDEDNFETKEQYLFMRSYNNYNSTWSSICVQPHIYDTSGNLVEDGGRCKNMGVLANENESSGEEEEEDPTKIYYYKVSTKYMPINVLCEKDGNKYYITKNQNYNSDSSAKDQYFIRFSATIEVIDGTEAVISKTILNKYFPIVLVLGDFDLDLINNIQVPKYVRYDTKGQNPQIDSNLPIQVDYNGIIYTDVVASKDTFVSVDNKRNLVPATTFKGGSFPNNSSSEIDYSNGLQRMPQEPMGAIQIKFKQSEKSSMIFGFIVCPIVMTLEGELTQDIEGYQGDGIVLNSNNTRVNPKMATGSVNSTAIYDEDGSVIASEGVFGGVVIGEEYSDKEQTVSGVYLYDQSNYSESNVLKTDGSFTLGGGAISCNVQNNNKNYTFDPFFLQQLLNAIEKDSTLLETFRDLIGNQS